MAERNRLYYAFQKIYKQKQKEIVVFFGGIFPRQKERRQKAAETQCKKIKQGKQKKEKN